jgi:hypothetical protein
MARKHRGTKAATSAGTVGTAIAATSVNEEASSIARTAELPRLETMQPCCVCGLRDARALLDVELGGGPGGRSSGAGARVVLCGSHDLAHRRLGAPATSAAELRALLADRRRDDRRDHGTEEVDELAASLASAFTRERRGAERRAV